MPCRALAISIHDGDWADEWMNGWIDGWMNGEGERGRKKRRGCSSPDIDHLPRWALGARAARRMADAESGRERRERARGSLNTGEAENPASSMR
jgi:hypothetical protein